MYSAIFKIDAILERDMQNNLVKFRIQDESKGSSLYYSMRTYGSFRGSEVYSVIG